MKYFIIPHNEGQELNYIETQEFPSYKHAKIYAREMSRKLAKVLVQATIHVEVEKAE